MGIINSTSVITAVRLQEQGGDPAAPGAGYQLLFVKAGGIYAINSASAVVGPLTGDHGGLTGLADDDHTQYHTDARGDARYPQLAHSHAGTTNGIKLAQANTHETPDTDSATSSLHHTIGVTATTAAAGNHTHAGGTLEVKEADGAPDVSGVTLITVSNGTLTDNGGGSVTLSTGGGTDPDAIHDNVAGEITALTDKPTPIGADVTIIEDSEAGNVKKKVALSSLSSAATPNRAYYLYQAALMEPLALEVAQGGSFTYSLTAGTPKILVASFNTKLGAAGRMEGRNPCHPLILNTGLSLAGLGADASAIILDPALPSYADAEATYWSRLNLLASNSAYAQKTCNLSAAQTVPFMAGPYGSLIVQLTSFDYDWIIGHTPANKGWNLWDEISDSATQRVGDAVIIPVSKQTICNLQSTGAGGTGTIVYVILPSSWGTITDATSYDFRDDFMGATLDTATDWTRAQSSAGNMEIDTDFAWLKCIGNANWGQNGVYSQSSIARANGKIFECDVMLNTAWTANGFGMVGFSDGAGQSYSNFSHGINFGAASAVPQLNIYENGNARGEVGSDFTLGVSYRVRITVSLSSNNAKYEIQGGPEYQPIGGATWTDITPGTTSSSTTPLYAGVTMFNNTMWIGDVKIY